MLEKMLEDHAFCICLRREILQKILYTTRMAKQPIIYLALTDDWELRGNGSGDMDEIQLKPMRRLASIYEKNGARGSFFIEVMQQRTFRRFQAEYPELKVLADQWEAQVKDVYQRGHDVQLHIHPQWTRAEYQGGSWKLDGKWSILDYPPEESGRLILEGKKFLEDILQSVDPDYRCLAFRAGAWCVAPSPHILSQLAEAGIILDASIVEGIHIHTKNLQLDYKNCEESFLPFYPNMQDARKISSHKEKIICVPTCHFVEPKRFTLRRHMKMAWRLVRKNFAGSSKGPFKNSNGEKPQSSEYKEWERVNATIFSKIARQLRSYLNEGTYQIGDLSALEYPWLCCMMKSIRKRARSSGLSGIPVILENHTKEIQSFKDIERFISDCSRAEDIQFITLTELAARLQNGQFKIQTATP
ncbi:MAG: hypothetical protein OEY26_02770 [Nitrospinota bacterium]|nr:hypothetical protein [Nitrospinota bacterium]